MEQNGIKKRMALLWNFFFFKICACAYWVTCDMYFSFFLWIMVKNLTVTVTEWSGLIKSIAERPSLLCKGAGWYQQHHVDFRSGWWKLFQNFPPTPEPVWKWTQALVLILKAAATQETPRVEGELRIAAVWSPEVYACVLSTKVSLESRRNFCLMCSFLKTSSELFQR